MCDFKPPKTVDVVDDEYLVYRHQERDEAKMIRRERCDEGGETEK